MSSESEIKGLVGFLEQLEQFYAQSGQLIRLQNKMLNDEPLKSIEELVKCLKLQVDTLILESETVKAQKNTAAIGHFYLNRFLKVRDSDIKFGANAKRIIEALQKFITTSQKRINECVRENTKHKETLQKVFEFARIAKITVKEDAHSKNLEDSIYQKQLMSIMHKLHYATSIFLPLAKATMLGIEVINGVRTADYDYKKEFQSLIQESKDQEEVVRMISEVEPKFHSLTSFEDKWEWISKEVRKVFDCHLYENIAFSLKCSKMSAGNEHFVKKMDARMQACFIRLEGMRNKLSYEENSLVLSLERVNDYSVAGLMNNKM